MKTKKIISIICAVAILLTLTLNFQTPVFAQTPNLRFGAISDVHITSSDGTCEGARYFKKTLEYYKTRGVDAILIAGDITDSGQDYQTKTIANVFNEVFKDQSTRPQKIFVPGNHDRYNGKTFDKMQSDFASFLGEENGAYIHKVINGYDFIGISHGGNVTTLKNFVKNAIAEAIKRDPNKPIFFTQHEHLPNTVYGSEDWSDGTLYDILK
ncbi:MAG: metallophosphoesterase, partial [Oscillospiraceae bacterium]